MKIETVLTADNIEMEYFSFGSGKRSMVILPGIGVKSVILSAKAVENRYRDFARDYTVYVFDRRRNLPERYSIREMADDTAAVMRTLGVCDADVFGASQGGMIAICLAAEHSELVHAVVLGSTAARCNEVIGSTVDRWITLAQKGDVTALTADFIDRLYSVNTVSRFRAFLIHMNDGAGERELRRFVILARSIERFDARDELKKLRCPTLVIGAENDLAVGAQASYEIAESLGCELYLYGSEYGHCVFDEAPDYPRRLMNFYKNHR